MAEGQGGRCEDHLAQEPRQLCEGFGPKVVGVAHDAAPEVIREFIGTHDGPRWATKRPGQIHEELIG